MSKVTRTKITEFYYQYRIWRYWTEDRYIEEYLKLNPHIEIVDEEPEETPEQLAERLSKDLHVSKDELMLYFQSLEVIK